MSTITDFITHSTDLELSSSQYWSHTDNASLGPTGNMTISMWVKLESAPALNTQMALISKDAAQRSYYIVYEDSAGTKLFRMANSADGSNVQSGTLNQTLTTATWYHLGFIYTASAGTCDVYKNGSSIGQITGLFTSIFDGNAPFNVGAINGGTFFDGLVADVRLWSRALTSGNMTSLYSAPGTFSNGANLEGWWFLNNTLDSSAAHDNSANDNDLTNNGTATFSTTVPYFSETILDAQDATSVDTISTFYLTFPFTLSETMGTPVETLQIRSGWGGQSKATGSWSSGVSKGSGSWSSGQTKGSGNWNNGQSKTLGI